LCALHVQQLQLDELYAVLSAVKEGEITEAKAIKRLSRSPPWVWVAIAPVTKLLVALDVGDRTQAMAQRFVHHVTQVLAPDGAPLFLTDGFRAYATALLTTSGQWVQPPRRQVHGPAPKPRWMPGPQLLYAPVVKTVRRRRLVRVSHRVVFGTVEAVQQGLAACGWQINTSFVERLNLNIRQHGRGGGTSGQYPVQGRGRLRPAAVLVPLLLQLRLAPYQFTPATPPAGPDH